MARGGEESGGRGTSPCYGDETDRRNEEEEEEPRDILAVCKHGNSLGIAAVRTAVYQMKLWYKPDRHSFSSDT